MSLRLAYTALAPFYDAIVSRATAQARRTSIATLPTEGCQRILLSGVGTGLDLPLLPTNHSYVALDLTRAMLERALPRKRGLNISWLQGDSQALPFGDGVFDHAVLHLILAVVPDSLRALRESARVVKSGGSLYIFDKFLRPGQRAPLRRLLNPLVRHLATRTNVVFEELIEQVPGLAIASDESAALGGWFRRIRLIRE
jgi:phosphatidylethanolamine/phosphatidyl-N-methylethanolamine N-methyltransferase